MNHALFRPNPTQLTVSGDLVPKHAEVAGNIVQTSTDDVWGERLDGRGAKLIAAPNRERQAVPFQITISLQDDIGSGVVGIAIHRVRSGVRSGGRKANIADVD